MHERAVRAPIVHGLFERIEHEAGVRIDYAEGARGRESCTVSGALADFAKRVGAQRVG